MEKSRSIPHGSSSFYSGLGHEDRAKSYSFNGPSGKVDGGFAAAADPEAKRKRRVASYNVFTMEANLKRSIRNSFKWVKGKLLSDVRYGE